MNNGIDNQNNYTKIKKGCETNQIRSAHTDLSLRYKHKGKSTLQYDLLVQ